MWMADAGAPASTLLPADCRHADAHQSPPGVTKNDQAIEPHPARRGRTAVSNGSSDRYGANLSTTSSCSARRTWRGVLKASYYNEVRTHLSLNKDAPEFRRKQKIGRIAAIPILGGLHHQYVRV